MPRMIGIAFRTLALAALAICVAASFNTLSLADEAATNNYVTKVELGIKPQITSPGAVVVMRANNTYVTFHAMQYGEEGASEGLAVIQLAGCSNWNFRTAGDEALAPHTVDIESLDCCETYEVLNSDWSATDPTSRHLIVTFLGLSPVLNEGATNFECLAQDATVHFFPSGPFEAILDYIDVLEAERPITETPEFPAEEEDAYENYDPYAETEDEYYSEEDYTEFE